MSSVIVCGGGTGGHLYPGIAVGEKLKELEPSLSLTFVGSSRRLETKIMEHQGVSFITLRIEGLKGKGVKILRPLLLLPLSFLSSFLILRHIKPKLVIGLGGYSSGPLVLLAAWMKIPTLILEQNVKLGFTNRILLPWVKKVVVAFEDTLQSCKGKGVYIGNPVRKEFYNLQPKLRNEKLSLLVFGGSQGSHFLNKGIVASLPLIKEEKDNLIIFHQSGEKDYEWVKESYSRSGFKEVKVAVFFFDMPNYFQKADLIICRAGATTIAELIASQKASLLIPFSKATDNHQVLNAMQLKKLKVAEVILEENFSPQIFARFILDFLKNKHKITQMEKNFEFIKKENVAEKIALLCLKLMEKKH